MAKLVYGLNQSLDGYVDHTKFAPELAQSLTGMGLIDEYRFCLHPVVLGGGRPFCAGPRPRLRLAANDHIAEDGVRLTYTPA